MLRVARLKLPNHKVINFELQDGDGIVIRGKNGSGKSLLLKSLARLVAAGYEKFDYGASDIKNWKPENYRSEVLYLSTISYFQKEGTVEDYFGMVRKLHVYKDHHSTFDYKHYLAKWHIPLEDFSRLSSGQRQMLSILRALTLRPKVLLLDEPTANLDQDKTREIEELVLEWKRMTNGSLVLISHSEEQAKRMGLKTVEFETLVEH